MKILRLSFKNIASFRSESLINIDFTKPPLSQNSLFLITGSTGAGKSTLLDAMTVALYNQYSREKSTNNFISSLAGNALIELEYEKDGTEYRNVWKINRSRDKIDGALQKSEMQLSLVKTNEIIASKKTDVIQKTTEILGLDFEQFTKTIILPQGDFANFLHAKDEVKIELFEKITDTKKYREFSQFVYLRNKEEEGILSKIFDSIGNVEPLNQENEQILTNEIVNLSKAIDISKEEIEGVKSNLQLLKSINDLSLNLKNIESQLSELLSNKEYFDSVELSITRAESANEIIRTIKNIKEQTTILLQKNEDLLRNSVKKSERELEYSQLQQQFELFSATYIQQKELVGQLYEKLPLYTEIKNRIQNLIENIQREEKEYLNHQNEYSSNEEAILQIKESIDNDSSQKNSLIKNQEKLSYLENASIHIERLKIFQKELERISLNEKELYSSLQMLSIENSEKANEIHQKQTKINEYEEKKFPFTLYSDTSQFIDEHLLQFCKLYEEVCSKLELINTKSKSLIELEEKVETAKIEFIHYRVDFDEKKNELETVSTEIVSLQLEMKIHSFRSQLIDGQPCPLCGSLDHTMDEYSHYSDDTLFNKIQSLQEQESKLEVTLFELQKNLNNIEQLQHQRFDAVEQFKREISTLQDEILLLNKALQLLPFPQNTETYDEIKTEISAREHNKILQLHIDNERILINRNTDDIENLNEKTIKIQQQIEVNKKATFDTQHAIEEIKSFYQFSNELSTDTFIQEVQTLFNQYKSNLEAVNQINQNIAVLTSRLKSILEGNQKLKIKIEEVQASVEANKKSLVNLSEEKRQLFGVSDIEELHNIAYKELQSQHSQSSSFQQLLQKKRDDYNSIEAEIKKVNNEISSYIEPRIEELTHQKVQMLNKYNFHSEDEIYLFEMDSESLQNNIKEVNDFKQNFANLEYDKNQKTSELELVLLSKPSESYDELEVYLANQESTITTLHQELGAKNLLFQQNEERKLQFKQYKNQYEHQKSITNRWNKLSAFIGSSDGKKYQRMVQRITMTQLLEFTNIHLKEFSNRYSVSLFSSDNDGNNQSLDLLIQDNDNNGKLRQVSTLSGGETFLVSLSMALGIATMISSTIEVESLFLDEGFGTLDSHTLEMVMLALENLQQKGRKIGIISHVEQLKERISTQIVVQSIGNGISIVFFREN